MEYNEMGCAMLVYSRRSRWEAVLLVYVLLTVSDDLFLSNCLLCGGQKYVLCQL